jgi:hypothetical protein
MIQWEDNKNSIPIKSWCAETDQITLEQAANLSRHPVIKEYVCLRACSKSSNENSN